ncbi:MAG: hypothetical protein OES18_13610, partial [Deltaproteobacteria bacterium]|nr:hypothetical protein [Deltaproteobacteria bacterium]
LLDGGFRGRGRDFTTCKECWRVLLVVIVLSWLILGDDLWLHNFSGFDRGFHVERPRSAEVGNCRPRLR